MNRIRTESDTYSKGDALAFGATMNCQMRLYSTYACGIRTTHLHPGVVLSPIELTRYLETISLTAEAYYRCLCAYHRHDFDLAAIARLRGLP